MPSDKDPKSHREHLTELYPSKCPYHNFANKLRNTIKKIGGDHPDETVPPDYFDENGKPDPLKLKTESYAAASFLIEDFWAFIKNQPEYMNHAEEPKTPLGPDFFADFTTYHIKRFKDYQEGWQNPIVDSISAKKLQNLNFRESMMNRFLRAKFEENPEITKQGFPAVSLGDLPPFFVRFVKLLDDVSKRDREKPLTSDELRKALKNPRFSQMFLELMTNERIELMGLMKAIDHSQPIDGEMNPGGSFDASRFYFEDEEKLTLGIDASFMQKFRLAVKNIFDKNFGPDVHKKTMRMGCPVLYTGLFPEMLDYMIDSFEYHYLSQLETNGKTL